MFDIDLKPCEKCLDGRYIHCYNTKCLKNSKLKSLLGTMDGYFWKYSKAYNYVDNYICCSNFLKEKLDTQERFKDKTIEMHNFKDIVPFKNIEKKGYILEFGHLSKDKGTDTLIEAAKLLPEYKFVFIGYGPSIEKMKNISNIEYLGFKTGEELYKIIAEAAVSVCPSEMYENCPFSVIESIALGTPVIGAKIGGIPELIEDGKTGELFEPGNVQELVQKIKKIMLDDEEYDSYVENCKLSHCETSETYYKKLIKIYRGDFKC